MGHGLHWAAAGDDIVKEYLEGAMRDTTLAGYGTLPAGVRVSYLAHRGDPRFGFSAVLASGVKRYLHSACPVAWPVGTALVRVDEVAPHAQGAEAVVRGKIAGGAAVEFFDPFFALHADAWKVGEVKETALSGIAFNAWTSGEEAGRGLALRPGRDDGQGFGVSYILGPPAEGEGSAACDFAGAATSAERFVSFERPLWQIRVKVGEDLEIPVVVAKRAWQTAPAGAGQHVHGVLWLQGFPAD
jgi:hypothetical protein